jgi:hypothetical protein
MRLIMVGGALVAAGCASTPTANNEPVERACGVSDCFLEREVRDFEVLDDDTIVVYVGSQRCAFQIELRGTFCDLTFAPELFFRSTREDLNQDREAFGAPLAGDRTNLRVCSNDLSIGVDGGPFTESQTVGSAQPVDRFGNPRSQCQLQSVASITDDELVELYVEHGVTAPPPPIGPGRIEVEEQEPGAQTEQGADAPAASPETAATGTAPASATAEAAVNN